MLRCSPSKQPRASVAQGIEQRFPVPCRAFDEDLDRVRNATEEELGTIDGVGPVMAQAFALWFADEKNRLTVDDLLTQIHIEKTVQPSLQGAQDADEEPSLIAGRTFVVTGAVNHYKSRRELAADIEAAGGKVTGSVSKKTDYLINNDAASSSSKNVTAKKLGIPIITEEEFLRMLNRKED